MFPLTCIMLWKREPITEPELSTMICTSSFFESLHDVEYLQRPNQGRLLLQLISNHFQVDRGRNANEQELLCWWTGAVMWVIKGCNTQKSIFWLSSCRKKKLAMDLTIYGQPEPTDRHNRLQLKIILTNSKGLTNHFIIDSFIYSHHIEFTYKICYRNEFEGNWEFQLYGSCGYATARPDRIMYWK